MRVVSHNLAWEWLEQHGYSSNEFTMEFDVGRTVPIGWYECDWKVPARSDQQLYMAEQIWEEFSKDEPEVLWWVRPTNWGLDAIAVGFGETLFVSHGLDRAAFGRDGVVISPPEFLVGAQLLFLSQMSQWEASWFRASGTCIIRTMKEGYTYVQSSVSLSSIQKKLAFLDSASGIR